MNLESGKISELPNINLSSLSPKEANCCPVNIAKD